VELAARLCVAVEDLRRGMHSESVPGLHGRSSGLSIPLRIGRRRGPGFSGPLSLRSTLVMGSGGGRIRTLDTPLRGIRSDSFTTVYRRSIFPLPKPSSRNRCHSSFIVVRDGLVYRLVYFGLLHVSHR